MQVVEGDDASIYWYCSSQMPYKSGKVVHSSSYHRGLMHPSIAVESRDTHRRKPTPPEFSSQWRKQLDSWVFPKKHIYIQ